MDEYPLKIRQQSTPSMLENKSPPENDFEVIGGFFGVHDIQSDRGCEANCCNPNFDSNEPLWGVYGTTQRTADTPDLRWWDGMSFDRTKLLECLRK
jgi:hypothetical protein